MKKDKDFEYDEAKVDETEVLNRPEDVGGGSEPEPEGEAPKVRVRTKEKAQKDILNAVAKAREAGTVDAELSDEDAAGVVAPVLDALYEAYEEDGTVPTREVFAERCGDDGAGGEVAGVVLAMERDPFVARRIGGKAIAAICAGCALVVALAGGGIWVAVGGQTQAAPETGTSVSAPAGMYDEDESQAESETDTKAESDTETEEDAQAVPDDSESPADEGASTDSGSGGESDGDGSMSGGSTGGSTGGSNSGGGSGSGSTSGGSSSSGGSSQSQHTHNWVAQTTTVHHDAVYKTVHHDAVYTTVHHDAVTESRSICNSCGADITGSESAHMKEYALKGDMTHSYSVKPVVVQDAYDEQVLVTAVYDEQVLVTAAYDETVTTGYKCSGCGATK